MRVLGGWPRRDMGELEFHAVWVSKEYSVIAFHIVVLCRGIEDLHVVVEQKLVQPVRVFSAVRVKGKMMQPRKPSSLS